MVRVAIAGGTGNLGRTILEVLQGDSHHEAFIISRKVGNIPLYKLYKMR